jgi:hypothetical protein
MEIDSPEVIELARKLKAAMPKGTMRDREYQAWALRILRGEEIAPVL